jgi:prepilin-type N-terminal cleavage/methylation domain-containing protein
MFEQKINNLIGKKMFRAIGGQKGFTLVEIVMVIVILGVIGAFTFQFVAQGVQAFKKSSARKDLYDQGRLALERMVRELRDTKEVTGSAGSSITFKKAHPAQAADNTEEVKFQLNGTNLERVGDPSGTPATAVLASNVSSFTVTGVGVIGGGGLCAITYDSVSTGTASYTTTETFSHTIGSGTNRVLVVGVTLEDCDDYPSVTGITYNGQPLTHIDSGQVISGNGCGGRAELWYLLEADLPSAGPYNVVVSTSGTFDELAAGAISLANVAQQAPEASNSSSNDAQTTISTNITTLTDGAWLVDVVHSGNETGDFVPNGGQTERYQQVSGSSTGAGSSKEVSPAGSTSAGWTSAGANRLAHAVAAFAPATAATGCGGGTTLFSDDFSDDVITGWSNASGGMAMAEAGGVFTTTGNNTSHYTVDVGSTWTDYSFNVDAMANDNDVVGITFRVEDADSFYVLDQRFGDGNWNLRLRLNDNGTWSTLGTVANNGANPGQVNSETTWYNFKVEVSGTNIKAYIDDVLKFDVTDATISGGTVGLWLESSGGTDFDNALVESSGGNLATLEITLSSAEGGTVSMRTMVYLRNVP